MIVKQVIRWGLLLCSKSLWRKKVVLGPSTSFDALPGDLGQPENEQNMSPSTSSLNAVFKQKYYR